MSKFISLSLMILLQSISFGQLNNIKLFLKSSHYTNTYDVYFKVIDGTATTNIQRALFNSQISIVTDTVVKKISIKNNMPIIQNQNYNGTVPTYWVNSTAMIKPDKDKNHNYFSITPGISPTSFFNNLKVDDEVKLFTVTTDTPICATKIKLYENGVDPNNISGADFTTSIAIGGVKELYTGNLPHLYELIPENLFCRGGSTLLTSIASLQWMIYNNNIIDINNNVLEGISYGVTEVKSNDLQGCASPTYRITVIDDAPHIYSVGDSILSSEKHGEFIWYDCLTNEILKESKQPYFLPMASGSYYAIIKTEHCEIKTDCVDFLLSDVNSRDFTSLIYPSMTNATIKIKISQGTYNLDILSIEGNLIKSLIHLQHNNIEELNLTSLSEGMYIIRLRGNESLSQKIIIKK